MKENEEKNIKKKLLSTFVVLAMVLTGFAAMFVATGPVEIVAADNGDEPNDDLPLLRIYGEENAIYPTQSYTGVLDFVYSSLADPFDPGAITKDSITFNPAYLDREYMEAERIDTDITIDGENSDEKVFLRLFYEPEYGHDIDSLMHVKYTDLQPVDFELGAVALEYTYMLLNQDGTPKKS